MSDLAAAVGIHQLKRAWQFQARRQELAAAYTAAFADLPMILPPAAPGDGIHAWHLYVIRLTDDAPISRAEFIQQMAERGIGCSVHFIPLHLHPYWRDTYQLTPAAFPCAQAAYERAVSLPLYTRMTAEDQQRVIETVKELLTAQETRTTRAHVLAPWSDSLQQWTGSQAELAACGD